MKRQVYGMHSDYRVEYFDTEKKIERIHGEWKTLVDSREVYRGNPFMDFGFIRAKIRSMMNKRTNRPLLAVLYAHGKVAAIAPLLIRTRIGIRYAVMLGDGCYDYGDVLFTNPDEALLLLYEIGRKYFFIKFDSLSAGSGVLDLAEKIRYSRTTKSCISPVIRLPFSPLNARKLKDTRYQIRRLEKNGSLSLQLIRGKADLQNELGRLFDMHVHQWNSKGDSSIFEDEENRILYRELVASLGEQTQVVLAILRYGDDVVAMHFGFESEKKLYYYKPTINVDYSKHSPGSVLLLKLVEDAQDRGMAMVDLLRGDEDYKLDWTEESIQQYSMTMACGILKWSMYQLFSLINETKKRVVGALSRS